MTEPEMKEQIQIAQDMLEGMQNQRNAHANECVQLAAQLKAAQRKIQELEKLAVAPSAPKGDEPALDGEIMPPSALSNGHAVQPAA